MPELHRAKAECRVVLRAYNEEHLGDRINFLLNKIRQELEKDESFDFFVWEEVPFEEG